MPKLTLEDLDAMDTEVLTCRQVASILGACEDTIRLAAVQAPRQLGFPVIVAGRRVKIPRRPFIRFMRGE